MKISKEEAVELCKGLLIDSLDYASVCFNSGILKCIDVLENMVEANEHPVKGSDK